MGLGLTDAGAGGVGKGRVERFRPDARRSHDTPNAGPSAGQQSHLTNPFFRPSTTSTLAMPLARCPQVQRFVQLCRSSGGSAQYRWNEQGVLGMLRHVFVPAERLLMLDFPYVHKGRPRDSLRAGGIHDVH